MAKPASKPKAKPRGKPKTKAPLIKTDGKPSKQGQGGGRPLVKLTPEQIEKVELLSSVLTLDQIADYFGIAHSTFDSILARDEEVSRLYKRGRSAAIGAVGSSLLKKARSGDNQSMFFYLKTQGGYRETTHVDHSSTDGTMSPAVLEGEALDKALAERGINLKLLEE